MEKGSIMLVLLLILVDSSGHHTVEIKPKLMVV